MNTTIIIAAIAALPHLTTVKPSEVMLEDGIVKERIETCASNILHHLKVQESFVQPFLDRAEVDDTGRFVGCGMLADGVVKAAAHDAGGAAMKALKDNILDQIISTQGEDGRVSIFKNTDGLGWWDNHDQAYFLQAFCHEWEYTTSEKALKAAIALGDYLISDERHTKVNLGIETAFVLLYKATGDKRYRDYLLGEFGIKDGMSTYADKLMDAKIPHGNPLLHVYSWQARALAESQYADVTGDTDSILRWSMDELWRRAFSPASSISGTMSGPTYEHWFGWGEKWNESNAGRGAWGETCVSAYSLRTAQYMFTQNPEPRFGDLYERVMYNAFFAAESADGTNYRYFTPFEEKGEWYDRETFCCPNNFRREIFEIPDSIYFLAGNDALLVNMYIPSRLRLNNLAVDLKTSYPNDGKGTIVYAGDLKKLYLRIPIWCKNAVVKCGETTYNPEGGTYLEIALNQNHEVTFDFPMSDRFIKGQRIMAGKVAKMRGPIVYGFADDGSQVRFADERRVRTYFEPDENLVAVDDELYSPVRWREIASDENAIIVDTENGLKWRTYAYNDFVVLENSYNDGEWKIVLIADPDYDGPIKAESPALKIESVDILDWFWTQDNKRMLLKLSTKEEYPSVMRDQARVCE